LNLLRDDADFKDAVNLAYAMEEGLRQFYLQLAKKSDDELYKEMYRELAQYELIHMQEIARDYGLELGEKPLKKAEQKYGGQLVEGGGYLDMSLIKTLVRIDKIARIFSLALAFETQALDFYYRLSMQAETDKMKRFFQEMADSERVHLSFVSQKLDSYLTS